MFDYVETLRVRRGVPWALAVVAVLILGFPVYALIDHTNVHLRTGSDFTGIPISVLMLIGSFVALIACVPFGASVCGQRAAMMTRWTLPVSRTRAILGIFAADVAAMAALAAGTFVVCLLAVAILGIFPSVYVDREGLLAVAGSAGAIIFYYGWAQTLSAAVPARGELLSGVAWVPFLFVVWFAKSDQVWPALHQAGMALLWIDPLGYLTGIEQTGSRHHASEVVANPLGLHPLLALALSLTLGVAMLAAATTIWKRREI